MANSVANAYLLIVCLVVSTFFMVHASSNAAGGTADGSEQWGYVEVRPKVHLFWWYYRSPHRVEDPSKPWPTILWLQGGPGASGVGIGNFLEFGPLDANLQPRNSTWLQKADLLFVDSPVGTGFSYTDDENLAVKTDVEAAADLINLLKQLYNGNGTTLSQPLRLNSPLFIFAESYGGKFAVTLGVAVLRDARLNLQLGGVALGDSWISPEDFVFSWGPLLKDVSRLDSNGSNQSNSLASTIQQQLAKGQSLDAEQTWEELESFIDESSNNVDFYNFLLDASEDPIASTTNKKYSRGELVAKRYSTYLQRKAIKAAAASAPDLDSLMNGPIKQKLKIIPPGVTWGGQVHIVFTAMAADFMIPRIAEVDELLAKGINVTIYNGQVDLICSTKGAESWVDKLKWDGLQSYLKLSRTPLYCGNDPITKGFFRSYKNLFFYHILGAGHFVPVDQPCIALQMVESVTRSPN